MRYTPKSEAHHGIIREFCLLYRAAVKLGCGRRWEMFVYALVWKRIYVDI